MVLAMATPFRLELDDPEVMRPEHGVIGTSPGLSVVSGGKLELVHEVKVVTRPRATEAAGVDQTEEGDPQRRRLRASVPLRVGTADDQAGQEPLA